MFKASIYLPSESNGALIDTDKRWQEFRYVARRLSEEFGGCTSVEAYGWWANNEGELIAEHVTILYSLVDENEVEVRKSTASVLRELAEHVKAVLNQQSVLTSIEPVTQVEFI